LESFHLIFYHPSIYKALGKRRVGSENILFQRVIIDNSFVGEIFFNIKV